MSRADGAVLFALGLLGVIYGFAILQALLASFPILSAATVSPWVSLLGFVSAAMIAVGGIFIFVAVKS